MEDIIYATYPVCNTSNRPGISVLTSLFSGCMSWNELKVSGAASDALLCLHLFARPQAWLTTRAHPPDTGHCPLCDIQHIKAGASTDTRLLATAEVGARKTVRDREREYVSKQFLMATSQTAVVGAVSELTNLLQSKWPQDRRRSASLRRQICSRPRSPGQGFNVQPNAWRKAIDWHNIT